MVHGAWCMVHGVWTGHIVLRCTMVKQRLSRALAFRVDASGSALCRPNKLRLPGPPRIPAEGDHQGRACTEGAFCPPGLAASPKPSAIAAGPPSCARLLGYLPGIDSKPCSFAQSEMVEPLQVYVRRPLLGLRGHYSRSCVTLVGSKVTRTRASTFLPWAMTKLVAASLTERTSDLPSFMGTEL